MWHIWREERSDRIPEERWIGFAHNKSAKLTLWKTGFSTYIVDTVLWINRQSIWDWLHWDQIWMVIWQSQAHTQRHRRGHTRSCCSCRSAHCKCKDPHDNMQPELYLFSSSSLSHRHACKIVNPKSDTSFMKATFWNVVQNVVKSSCKKILIRQNK